MWRMYGPDHLLEFVPWERAATVVRALPRRIAPTNLAQRRSSSGSCTVRPGDLGAPEAEQGDVARGRSPRIGVDRPHGFVLVGDGVAPRVASVQRRPTSMKL